MKLYERTAAIDDITRAVVWIAWDNPSASRRLLSAVRRSWAQIQRFPLIGIKRRVAEPGLRSWRVSGFPYLVFYKPAANPAILHLARFADRA